MSKIMFPLDQFFDYEDWAKTNFYNIFTNQDLDQESVERFKVKIRDLTEKALVYIVNRRLQLTDLIIADSFTELTGVRNMTIYMGYNAGQVSLSFENIEKNPGSISEFEWSSETTELLVNEIMEFMTFPSFLIDEALDGDPGNDATQKLEKLFELTEPDWDIDGHDPDTAETISNFLGNPIVEILGYQYDAVFALMELDPSAFHIVKANFIMDHLEDL